MSRIFKVLLVEATIILALWSAGAVIFATGAMSLRVQKEHYWASTMTSQPGFRALSSGEKQMAQAQFMMLWAVKPGDAPFAQGDWKIYWAYGAQAIGFWLRQFWLFIYMMCVVMRLAFRLQKTRQKTVSLSVNKGDILKEEMRILALFLMCALAWYLVWRVLAPSLYVFYERFFARSYAYLWKTQMTDFYSLAKGWFVIVAVYPFTAGVRCWRRFMLAGKAR